MNKLYERQYWNNNTNPALNDTNLNALSKAVDDIDDRVIEMEGNILESVATANTAAQTAQEAAADAQSYATQAGASEANASRSATAAQTAANNAQSYASTASTAATTATNKAAEAASSATTATNRANEATSAATSAANSATRAESWSAHPPYIGDNGNWYVWDIPTAAYVDSHIDASITLQIADITMLDYDDDPYVTNSGTSTDAIFHLFLPQGKSAYASAVDGGYTDTEEQFYRDLADLSVWATQAATSATNAAASATQAATSASDAATSAVNAATSALNAATSETNASTSATNAAASAANANTSELYAQNHALDAEAWAVGQRNRTDVPSTDVTYENNSKFYAQAAETSKTQILAMYQEVITYKNLLQFFFGTLNVVTESGDKLITETGDYIAMDY